VGAPEKGGRQAQTPYECSHEPGLPVVASTALVLCRAACNRRTPRSMRRSMVMNSTSKRLRCDLLLMLYIFAHLTTVMDSSSEFHQLAFAHGATVEGQFLASLAPATRGGSACSCRDKASTSAKARASGGGEDTMWHGGVDDSQRFFRVRVRPSHSKCSCLGCSARRAVHQRAAAPSTHTHDGAGAHR
jgi:hypothetical protein